MLSGYQQVPRRGEQCCISYLLSTNKCFRSFLHLSKMLMPKKNRVAIYEHLFKEGVMVAEKNFHAPKHPELEQIPNLQVDIIWKPFKIYSVLSIILGDQGFDLAEIPRLR